MMDYLIFDNKIALKMICILKFMNFINFNFFKEKLWINFEFILI